MLSGPPMLGISPGTDFSAASVIFLVMSVATPTPSQVFPEAVLFQFWTCFAPSLRLSSVISESSAVPSSAPGLPRHSPRYPCAPLSTRPSSPGDDQQVRLRRFSLPGSPPPTAHPSTWTEQEGIYFPMEMNDATALLMERPLQSPQVLNNKISILAYT